MPPYREMFCRTRVKIVRPMSSGTPYWTVDHATAQNDGYGKNVVSKIYHVNYFFFRLALAAEPNSNFIKIILWNLDKKPIKVHYSFKAKDCVHDDEFEGEPATIGPKSGGNGRGDARPRNRRHSEIGFRTHPRIHVQLAIRMR